MAGDWIKMRTSLLTNPRVNGIARELEASIAAGKALSNGYGGVMSEIVTRAVMRHVTVSSLLVVWGAANEHTRDGVFSNADLSDIDDMTGIPGFGDAMWSVGWAVYDSEKQTVTLPNFSEYNTSGSERSATAKTGAERQKEYRERHKHLDVDVTSDAKSDVTSNRREEKSREDKKEERGARATRIPDDFNPELDADAEAGIDRAKELANFRDYWTSKARDNTKLDWQATWRQWARKADRPGVSRFAKPEITATVPSRQGRDPELTRLEIERQQRTAPSLATLAAIAKIKQGVTA